MRRSFPEMATMLLPRSASDSDANGNVPALVSDDPDPPNTSVRCPSETYKRLPVASRADARVTVLSVPLLCGDEGTVIEKASTEESPSAAYSVVPMMASEVTAGLLVGNVAGEAVVGSG